MYHYSNIRWEGERVSKYCKHGVLVLRWQLESDALLKTMGGRSESYMKQLSKDGGQRNTLPEEG